MPEPPPDPTRCPRCRMPIHEGAEFCNACGLRLRPAPRPAVPIPDAPWAPKECPHCGRPWESGFLLASDGAGTPLPPQGIIRVALEYFTAPAIGEELSARTSQVVAWGPRFRIRRASEAQPLWYRCVHCRLLRYPEPSPEP